MERIRHLRMCYLQFGTMARKHASRIDVHSRAHVHNSILRTAPAGIAVQYMYMLYSTVQCMHMQCSAVQCQRSRQRHQVMDCLCDREIVPACSSSSCSAADTECSGTVSDVGTSSRTSGSLSDVGTSSWFDKL